MAPVIPTVDATADPVVGRAQPPCGVLRGVSLPGSSIPGGFSPPKNEGHYSGFVASAKYKTVDKTDGSARAGGGGVSTPVATLLFIVVLFPAGSRCSLSFASSFLLF